VLVCFAEVLTKQLVLLLKDITLAMLFFFQKKKQKALVCFAEVLTKQLVLLLKDITLAMLFFFQKKKQKVFVLLRRSRRINRSHSCLS
jgi:hypothetical protein